MHEKVKKESQKTPVCELNRGAKQVNENNTIKQGESVKYEDVLWNNTTLDIVCNIVCIDCANPSIFKN